MNRCDGCLTELSPDNATRGLRACPACLARRPPRASAPVTPAKSREGLGKQFLSGDLSLDDFRRLAAEVSEPDRMPDELREGFPDGD